jgi:hypothetical protein
MFTDGDLTQPGIVWAPGYVPPAPGQCYNYQVEAFNSAGNSGVNINGPVQMCTTGAPAAPTNLTAVAPLGTQVNLTWMPGSGTVTGYRVERSIDGGTTWTQIATGVATTIYSDMGVSPGTRYWYRVFAYNAQGESGPPTWQPCSRLEGCRPPPSGCGQK